jgi:hypothetical protein
MGILSGSISLTRFNISPRLEEPPFGKEAFVEIQPGTTTRETSGFLPYEPEAPYQTGAARYFFRVRFDKLTPDPVAVKERLRELVRLEFEQGAEFVGPKKRKMLKELAEEEMLAQTRPRTKIIEACMDGSVLYVGSTAKNYIGRVLELLRRIGVHTELKAPWLERDDPEVESSILEMKEPGESVLGSRFLKLLVGDREILIEPENGMARLQTKDAKVSLTGAILPDLIEYIEEGAEVLSAKLLTAIGPMKFDGLPFRISNLRIETEKHDHWTEYLDERLQKVAAVFELLEGRYEELRPQLIKD